MAPSVGPGKDMEGLKAEGARLGVPWMELKTIPCKIQRPYLGHCSKGLSSSHHLKRNLLYIYIYKLLHGLGLPECSFTTAWVVAHQIFLLPSYCY